MAPPPAKRQQPKDGRWFLMGVIIMLSGAGLLGCYFPSSSQRISPQSLQPLALTPINPASTLDLNQLQRLQTCVAELDQPRLLRLEASLPTQTDGADGDAVSYYAAFSIAAMDPPWDMGQVSEFQTLAVVDGECQRLEPDQGRAIAEARLALHYADVLALHQGEIGATWGQIVNRWERDHYVSGPGDHPLSLPIEDIWMARTLGLQLPNYIPIHISPPKVPPRD